MVEVTFKTDDGENTERLLLLDEDETIEYTKGPEPIQVDKETFWKSVSERGMVLFADIHGQVYSIHSRAIINISEDF